MCDKQVIESNHMSVNCSESRDVGSYCHFKCTNPDEEWLSSGEFSQNLYDIKAFISSNNHYIFRTHEILMNSSDVVIKVSETGVKILNNNLR